MKLLISSWLFLTSIALLHGQENGWTNHLGQYALMDRGGLVRADTTKPVIYLSFTGGDYNDGGKWISKVLKKKKVKAHFFLTGDFYRDRKNEQLIRRLIRQGHYLGPHSDKHLLYAPWTNRDSLLVTEDEFKRDLENNYREIVRFGINRAISRFFMPPYEWYNQQISSWTNEMGSILVNFTPGTRSNADYTTPDMGERYIGSEEIYDSIIDFEKTSSSGLNGFILLLHVGTHPSRTDKFYYLLPPLIDSLRSLGYQFDLLTKLVFAK
ncbi:MAG: polysaccharide deacetylase family protein [Saprospiraceae bacterium]|nr:polysaccharide deacetylase family protein [Saprospiraceae bacterium]